MASIFFHAPENVEYHWVWCLIIHIKVSIQISELLCLHSEYSLLFFLRPSLQAPFQNTSLEISLKHHPDLAPRLVRNKVTCVAPVACLALSSFAKFSLLVCAGHRQHAHKNPQNRQNQTIRHCTRRSNHSPAFHVHFFSLKGTYNILETFFNLQFFLKGNSIFFYRSWITLSFGFWRANRFL